MRVVAVPVADPQLELRWLPDPGFLIQGFLIQCLRRNRVLAKTCHGAESALRSKKGSRAQARNDFARGVLPGKAKEPIDELVRPAAATRRRWAKALAATVLPEGSEDLRLLGLPRPAATVLPSRLAMGGHMPRPAPVGSFSQGLTEP